MEILVGILLFIVAFVLGGAYGYKLRERVAERVLAHLLDEAEKEEKTHDDKIQIVVEKHEDRIFIYKKDTHEFMAQGSSYKELNDALENRYPGKKFACSEEHLNMIKAM